jgi:branched-chain amino acid transport system ATP-binding protein
MSESDSSSAVLTLSNVSSRRAGLEVIHSLSFELRNELLVLVGLNGSGKSTLLRTIIGLTPVTAGTITLRGTVVSGRPCHQIVRLGISFMPQFDHTFPGLSVLENLYLGGYLLPKKDLRAEIDRQLDRVPKLRRRLNVAAGALSGGERQMLALAKALMARPQVLLLDEPSAGLSPAAVIGIFDILELLREEGIPILLVEQNIRRAVEISDRAAVMYLGRCRDIIDLKSKQDFPELLRSAMLGPRAIPPSE